MTVERAGEGAGEGCDGSSAAVERGRVRWVVGGGGAGEGAGGRVLVGDGGAGDGCGGTAAAVELAGEGAGGIEIEIKKKCGISSFCR